MAALILVCASSTHAATTETKSALESVDGGSHTVTVVQDSSLGGVTWSDYEAVILVRPTSSLTVADAIRARVDAGQPVFWTLVDAGSTGTSGFTSNATRADLCETLGFDSSVHSIGVTDDTHEITDAFGTGNEQIYSSITFAGRIDSGASFVGDSLADMAGSGTNIDTLVAIENGTADLAAATIDARVVLFGYLYGGSGYTTGGTNLLRDAVQWLLDDPGPGGGGGGGGGGRRMLMGVG